MKRKFYNNSLKAVAVGVAVTMASTTALTTYADDNAVATLEEVSHLDEASTLEEPVVVSSSSYSSSSASESQAKPNIDDTITVSEGNVTYTFKVTKSDDTNSDETADGEVTLVSINESAVSASEATNHTGTLTEANVINVSITGGQKALFKITQIGDDKSIADGQTISASSLTKVLTTDLSKIGASAFANVTIDGTVTFPAVDLSGNGKIGAKAFQNTHIKGDLDFTKLSPQKLDLSNQPFRGKDDIKGITVDGIFKVYEDESSVKTHQFKANEFENISVKELKIASISAEDYTFKGATIGNEETKETELLKTLRNPFNKGHLYGATVNGKVSLTPNNTGDFTVKEESFANSNIYTLNLGAKESANFKAETDAFKGATIENLEVSNDNVTFGEEGIFTGATINNLGNVTEKETIPANIFKGANIPSYVELPNATTIGANAFAVANTEKVTISLPNYKKENLENIDANAFGTGSNVTVSLPVGTSQEDLKAFSEKFVNANVVAQTTVKNQQGTYTFQALDTEKEVALVDYKAEASVQRSASSFENGILTVDDVQYKLTKLGNGTDALSSITDAALNGNVANIKEIAPNALKDSKITTLTLPAVEKIGANAFANSTISNLSLAENTNKTVSIDNSAFSNVKTLNTVKTNNASKDSVKASLENSSSNDISLVTGNKTENVRPSSSSSSSGGNYSGGGAVINAKPNDETTESTTSGNNSNISEDKDLTLDVISLPSVEGEAKVFGDVNANHWAKAHIDKLSTAGVINGANGMFNPNGQTKRADATIMLVNLLGLSPEANNKFADVNPSAYYAPYVGTASTYGIVNGSNGMFNPEGIISRQDTMVMIAQILKSLDLNVNTDSTVLNQFSDASKVAPYANESVAILINSGIISGNNGKLNPTAPVTRAEMATIMSKLYDVLAEAK